MPGRWSGAQERTSGSEGPKKILGPKKKIIESKLKILPLINGIKRFM